MSTNPFKAIQVTTIDDPSIDLDNSNLIEYAKTRDISHLKFREGQVPYLFKIEKIPTSTLIRWSNLATPDALDGMIFLATCKEYTDSDGVEHKAETKNDMAQDEWLDQIQEEIGYEALAELIKVAARFQKLSKRDRSFF
jgi:hypothetical protein